MFLSKTTAAIFRGNDECTNSIKSRNYIELLNLLSNYDIMLADHKKSTVFHDTPPNIDNNHRNSISKILLKTIQYEIAA